MTFVRLVIIMRILSYLIIYISQYFYTSRNFPSSFYQKALGSSFGGNHSAPKAIGGVNLALLDTGLG
jgi:hypothetical protein